MFEYINSIYCVVYNGSGMKNTIDKRKCIEKKEKKQTKLRESKIFLFFFKSLSFFSITLPELVNIIFYFTVVFKIDML